jgi:hypothetical protein
MATSLLNRLPPNLATFLAPGDRRLWVPKYRNRQVTVNLHETVPENAGYLVMTHLNNSLRQNPVLILNRPVFVSRDMRKWQKQRNGALTRAKKLLDPYLPDTGLSLVQDWPGGQIYLKHDDGTEALVGIWKRAEGFSWRQDALKRVLPNADIAKLVEGMHA